MAERFRVHTEELMALASIKGGNHYIMKLRGRVIRSDLLAPPPLHPPPGAASLSLSRTASLYCTFLLVLRSQQPVSCSHLALTCVLTFAVAFLPHRDHVRRSGCEARRRRLLSPQRARASQVFGDHAGGGLASEVYPSA